MLHNKQKIYIISIFSLTELINTSCYTLHYSAPLLSIECWKSVHQYTDMEILPGTVSCKVYSLLLLLIILPSHLLSSFSSYECHNTLLRNSARNKHCKEKKNLKQTLYQVVSSAWYTRSNILL